MAKDYDELIGDALGDYMRAEARSGFPVDGAAAARATVTRRHRVRVAVLSALGVLLISVPMIALAAERRGGDSLPTPADSGTPAPPSATPSTDSTPSPS